MTTDNTAADSPRRERRTPAPDLRFLAQQLSQALDASRAAAIGASKMEHRAFKRGRSQLADAAHGVMICADQVEVLGRPVFEALCTLHDRAEKPGAVDVPPNA